RCGQRHPDRSDRLDQVVRQRAAARSLLSKVVGVLPELPVGRPGVEAFGLISLVRTEGLDELLAKDSGHIGVRLEGVERRGKITGKLVRLARVVSVALKW